ncbi:hypothetical protein NIES25_33660 [Nostoc linckia NIES-25]|nr:hypothetical protein NIES25_33660 [Nostoc linckia NIES-25]
MAGFVIIHLPCYLQTFTWDKSKNNLFGENADIAIAGWNQAEWLNFGRLKNQMTAPQPIIFTNSHLYDQDFYLWIDTTAKQLKEGRFSEVDLENPIEEIECMGRSEKHALASNLVVLLMHLLKYKYQPEKRSNIWKVTIREHRRRLRITFKDSPSLKPYFQ